jgi:hypothetical protein
VYPESDKRTGGPIIAGEAIAATEPFPFPYGNLCENIFLLLCFYATLTRMDTPKDLISATEARKLLGVSPKKMAQLLKEDVIRHFPNPLDARAKLVSKSEVLNLATYKREAAA